MGDLYRCDSRGVVLVTRPSRWKDRVRRSSPTCRWCGCAIHADGRGGFDARATVDHIQPTGLGGQNVALNTKASCARCNAGRSLAGHCYLTYRCIEAIVGASHSAIARYYNQSRRPA